MGERTGTNRHSSFVFVRGHRPRPVETVRRRPRSREFRARKEGRNRHSSPDRATMSRCVFLGNACPDRLRRLADAARPFSGSARPDGPAKPNAPIPVFGFDVMNPFPTFHPMSGHVFRIRFRPVAPSGAAIGVTPPRPVPSRFELARARSGGRPRGVRAAQLREFISGLDGSKMDHRVGPLHDPVRPGARAVRQSRAGSARK